MQVVVHIAGRQAIPVRAIPLLTDWEVLSPDVCANAFAGAETTTQRLEGLATYRLDETGEPQHVAPRWWANWIVRGLDACSERITAAQTSHEAGYQQWRSESLELLPGGVFVWRDEFERAFLREYGPQSMRARFAGEGYDENLHRLNFDPKHGPRKDWQTLVMEGFEPERLAIAHEKKAENAGFIIGIYSGFNIEQWARHHIVAPAQAARLLCGRDPLDPDPDSRDAQTLAHLFQGCSTSHPGPRTLLDWVRIAREHGANHSDEIGRAVEFLSQQDGGASIVGLSEAPAQVGGQAVSAQPQAAAPAPVVAESASNGPPPLTTSDIAFCFDGIRWNEKQWRKPLGDKPKWLQRCVAIPGQQGVSETRWNPVLIAAALVHDGNAKARTIRARFQTKPQLKDWLEVWKTYEADNFDTQ